MKIKIHKRPIEDHNTIDFYLFKYLINGPITMTYNLGLTPNFLTTISFLLQLYSIYNLTLYSIGSFQFYYLLGYYFDCIDGPMARKYDMVTKFGDFYDHGTDTICFSWVLYYYFTYYKLLNYPIINTGGILIFLGLIKYIGCQETIYNKSVEKSEVSFNNSLIGN